MDLVTVLTAVNAGAAIVAAIVAIVFGIKQYTLSKRVSQFENRQDVRDEKRHTEAVRSEVVRFVQKYSKRGHDSEWYLMPLCVAAAEYDRAYPYQREMYREFCGLSMEVQNAILDYIHLYADIRCKEYEQEVYYNACEAVAANLFDSKLPSNQNLIRTSGKYLKRTLCSWGAERVDDLRCPIDKYEREILAPFHVPCDMSYKTHVNNVLMDETLAHPVSELETYTTSKWGSPVSGKEAAMCALICYICLFLGDMDVDVWPEGVGTFLDDYTGPLFMEDLFLRVLFLMRLQPGFESEVENTQ